MSGERMATKTKSRQRPHVPQPAEVVPEAVRRYRFTPEQFEQLGALGLFQNQRVELIEGEIVQMPPVGPEHGSTVDQTMLSLGRRLSGKSYYVRVQNPLRLGGSEPYPDIAIVPGKPSDYRQQHPTTALLVIEIADTSLEYDRTEKMSLYASAGIPEYWIVNLVERCLEVYREPVSSVEGTAFNARYRALRYYSLDEVVRPLFEPTLEIPVKALFEGEE
ncbi:Endonuclease, Uma2 family (restriction endonuclease fold) [Armatimonadetes bacterium DC]|nr:Endonuclease, Uma2 family (restriction endonuclease fold) [Armatimonadetes bacterium DC]